MINIGLVYFTNTDVTGTLVKAAAGRIESSGAQCTVFKITGKDIVDGRFTHPHIMTQLHDCQGIVFASPTYMGGVAAQFKAFADATSDFWQAQTWAGKLAAGITSGSALNGDQSATLGYLATLASQHGMIWIGLDTPYSLESGSTQKTVGINRLGCHLGVTAHSPDGKVAPDDIKSAEYLADRVVAITRQFTR